MNPIDVEKIETDIRKCKAAIRRVKNETIQHVAFLPTGKIEVIDKGALEALNNEAERLAGLVEHNGEVLDRLRAVLGDFETVADLEGRRSYTETHIAKAHSLYSIDLGTYLKDFRSLGRPVDLETDPKALKLKAARDEKLSSLEPELKALSERLDEARAIIAEAKLSGLPDALEGDPYRQAVTWEDTAALRGSGGDVGRGCAGPK